MSYFQKHMRLNSNENESSNNNFCKNAHATPIAHPHKFKKNPTNRSKVSDCNILEDNTHASRQRTREQDYTHSEMYINKPTHKIEPPPSRKPQLKASQKSILQPLHTEGDKINTDFQTLMIDADNSMQELLNSSINQFSKYLEGENLEEEQHQHLLKQNEYLKTSLEQLKVILKQKLENALKKQKQELNTMMEDYIGLITKLLKDKEELTTELEKRDSELKDSQIQRQCLLKQQERFQLKMEDMSREKDIHIEKTKHQIEDFLRIIDQYEEEGDQENKQNEQMRQRIEQLEQQIKAYENTKTSPCNEEEPQQKITAQASKIQILIQLLEQYQNDNSSLRDSLANYEHQEGRESQGDFQNRIEQLEREHEEEFIEYERAMRQTLNKKDECIERLNMIIESYRQKRDRTTKEISLDTTVSLPNDPSN